MQNQGQNAGNMMYKTALRCITILPQSMPNIGPSISRRKGRSRKTRGMTL